MHEPAIVMTENRRIVITQIGQIGDGDQSDTTRTLVGYVAELVASSGRHRETNQVLRRARLLRVLELPRGAQLFDAHEALAAAPSLRLGSTYLG